MWGYVAQGLYTQEEVDAINDPSNTDVVRPTFGEVKAGDIKYKNLNNDKVIDDYDMTVIGHSQVRANYGLTVDLQYKNFGLFIYAYARKGASRYFNGDYYHVYGEKKYPTHLTGRWAYDPENGIDNREGATHPRLTTLQNENNAKNSTWWIRSTDHFSLADVQLTYTFGPTMLKAMRLKGLMLYVKGQNLLTLGSNVKEMQLNVGSEPQYRYIAIGLNVKF